MKSFMSSSTNVDRVKQRLPTRRTGIFIAAAFALLFLTVVFCVSIQQNQSKNNRMVLKTSVEAIRTSNKLLKGACDGTPHPQVCVSTLAGFPGSPQTIPLEIVNVMVRALIGVVERTFIVASKLTAIAAPGLEQDALDDCMELLDSTVDDLSHALAKFTSNAGSDVRTFLSAGLTNQDTCMEGLATTKGIVKEQLQGGVIQISELVSNSLAMFKKIPSVMDDLKRPPTSHNRRLLFDPDSGFDRHEFGSEENGFPRWLSAGDRRLLQVPQSNLTADVVVALDGTGNYTNITDAIMAAPDYSTRRYVIHVKAGVYNEQVVIKKKKTNLMFIGDGMDSTVITGNRNVYDGTTTFRSATFAVTGSGFIARDIGFENTAGPFKSQAVALRVGSDQSVLYRCGMKGYQDTLYAHSLRQFYRECKIYGTVDFIFGNAAVVFQNCVILARRPLANQVITVTAQSRKDPNQNTGTSIHSCNISAAPDLVPVKSMFPAYLGRPWKPFSRTIFMQSFLGDIVRPEGWVPWNASNLNLDTLFYGEYMNFGPGAGVAKRVTWPGFHTINSSVEANAFTVAQFIDGNKWLPSTGVAFLSGLS